MSLIAQYLFNDNANDETGIYDGTDTNVTYEIAPSNKNFSGKVGVFNGVSSKIDLPNTFNIIGNNSRSIEFWLKTSRLIGPYRIFWSGVDTTNNLFGIQLYQNLLQNDIYNPGHGGQFAFSNTEWCHCVFTYQWDSSTGQHELYLNGVVQTNQFTNNTFTLNTTNTNFAIGYRPSANSQWLDAKLANFRIYDHVLSAAEVLDHYNTERQAPQKLCQFRPADTSKWSKKYTGIGAVAATISSDATLANSYYPLPTAAVNTQPTLTGASDGIYVLHQTRATDNDSYDHNWELNQLSGGQFKLPLTRAYTTDSSNLAQAIKAACYTNLTIDSGATLSVSPWNSATGTGGVGVIVVSGTLTINGTISASGQGFVGGSGDIYTAGQGESVIGAGTNAYTSNGAGGGGGAGNNNWDYAQATGGGGGHAAAGGNGARAADGSNYDGSAGVGGTSIGAANLKVLYLGAAGGGGAAYKPNSADWQGGGNGGNGGGAIIILARKIVLGTNGAIVSDGDNGEQGTNAAMSGASGGGAGGSIAIFCQQGVLGTSLVTANGGASASNNAGSSGAGSVGRIITCYSKSLTGTTSPTATSIQDEIWSMISGGSALIMNFLDEGM